MSLRKPHPMLQFADNSYKVNKITTVLRMLSGRFRSGSLLRHFSANISGICELCQTELEDLPHILTPRCPALHQRAAILMKFSNETLTISNSEMYCAARMIFNQFMLSEDDLLKVQFVLDPSVVHEVIVAEQTSTKC